MDLISATGVCGKVQMNGMDRLMQDRREIRRMNVQRPEVTFDNRKVVHSNYCCFVRRENGADLQNSM
jgi:hypothetical protein